MRSESKPKWSASWRAVACLAVLFVLASAASAQTASIKSWGSGDHGQLGNGLEPWRTAPGKILQPVFRSQIGNMVLVAGGRDHSLAIKSDRSAWAWGSNRYGKLGTSSTAPTANVPATTANLTEMIAIAAGHEHTLAVKSDHTVWAWGSNLNGVLGRDVNTLRESGTPVQVTGLARVVAVAAGAHHSLALKDDGTVWAWGGNSDGQLGSPLPYSTTPVQVSGLTDITAIAAGPYHSVALKRDGTVWAWGSNRDAQLGSAYAGLTCTYPVRADNLTGVTAIAAGDSHTVALTADRHVWTWGANRKGQLGTPSTAGLQRRSPGLVAGLSNVSAIAAGAEHSLALRLDGSVFGWGGNSQGQLGSGDTADRATPAPAISLPFITAIGAGGWHSLAAAADGTAWAWGANTCGQLGLGFDTVSEVPTAVNLTYMKQVAAGGAHSLARSEDGTVWSWGDNSAGQLGTGSAALLSTAPQRVWLFSGARSIAAGELHSLMLARELTVWAWGANESGQLGDGTQQPKHVPVQVTGLNGVIEIAAGAYHSLALKFDGTVWAWGANHSGQVGTGYPDRLLAPIQVPNLTGVKAIAAGQSHSLAVTQDGRVWAWGNNESGQLGDGSHFSRPVPVAINLSGVKAVAAGVDFSLALRNDGSVWGWGMDRLGIPGGYGAVPVQASGLTGVLAIAAGAHHSLMLTADRRIWARGENNYGQLGTGTITDTASDSLTQPGWVSLSNAESAVAIAAGGRHSLAAVYVDRTPPEIGLANSEWLYTGTPYSVRWSASDDTSLEHFTLWFAADGSYFSRITECSNLRGSVRSCVWHTPGPSTTAGRFRITTADRAGNFAESMSGTPVVIKPGTASLNLTAPMAGAAWSIGSTQRISWTSNLGPTANITIELRRDGGATWSLLIGAINRGYYDWPVTGPAATQARIRLTWYSGPGVKVTSAAFPIYYTIGGFYP